MMQINIQHIGTLTSTSFSFRGNQVHAEFTDNSIQTTYSYWKFSGSVTLDLTVTIIPNQSQSSGESVYSWIKQHLEENLMIGLAVTVIRSASSWHGSKTNRNFFKFKG